MKNIILILLLLSFRAFGQNETKCYFIFQSSKLKSSDIKRKINFLIENSQSKKVIYEILHYSENTEISEKWVTNKINVNYKPFKIGCDFSICNNISAIISVTKTDKSRMFLTEKKMECELGIETVLLSNKDESTIIEKLKEENARIKQLKINQSIYFFFNDLEADVKPSVRFESDIINVKESEKIKLNPSITGNITKYQWEPATGLSCTNCKSPELKVLESKKYTLTVTDSSGCNTLSTSIDVKVEKNCLCSNDIAKVEIVFGKLPIRKYEEKNPLAKAEWDWRIISNQSGGYVFDLVASSNCSKKFKVRVLRKNGGVIFDQQYEREDIDKRSRNPYHEKYPDNFVFRIDLSSEDSYLYINDTENEPYFIIEITPIDDNGEECVNKTYRSPKLRPTKCN